ncbi:MAG: zf-HC2 domain-containing protein [Armatimonadota bacterium]|nr:zf-HC2 domain-containing protein [Armatimonadota bacterium]
MNCSFAEDQIQKSLDGILTSAERERLDAHLISCPECRCAWDEHRMLARAAGRWTQPAAQDDPGDAFTARVMALIAARPEPAFARTPFWLPLAATALLLTLLALLPSLLLPSVDALSAAVRETPFWFLTNLRGLPGDVVTTWNALAINVHLPTWIWGVLLAMGVINAMFCVQVRQAHARRSLL